MSETVEERQQRQRKALMARLARIEGQIRGLRRMIESGSGCEDVAQQMAASRKALNRAFYEMMACAIEQEVDTDGLPPEAQEKLDELTRVLAKYG